MVVFSTSSNPKDLTFCYASGANAYHVKPLRYHDHLTLLRTVLSSWLESVLLPDPNGP